MSIYTFQYSRQCSAHTTPIQVRPDRISLSVFLTYDSGGTPQSPLLQLTYDHREPTGECYVMGRAVVREVQVVCGRWPLGRHRVDLLHVRSDSWRAQNRHNQQRTVQCASCLRSQHQKGVTISTASLIGGQTKKILQLAYSNTCPHDRHVTCHKQTFLKC
jgi:hypothetical protein